MVVCAAKSVDWAGCRHRSGSAQGQEPCIQEDLGCWHCVACPQPCLRTIACWSITVAGPPGRAVVCSWQTTAPTTCPGGAAACIRSRRWWGAVQCAPMYRASISSPKPPQQVEVTGSSLHNSTVLALEGKAGPAAVLSQPPLLPCRPFACWALCQQQHLGGRWPGMQPWLYAQRPHVWFLNHHSISVLCSHGVSEDNKQAGNLLPAGSTCCCNP